ncbi:FtsX-like permease family protein [Plantibacter auratus]|uniref:FtsX-like permease family protein n=1 Tax=Plantibacter auratus TaxID=272914 RepID=UPI003D3259A2
MTTAVLATAGRTAGAQLEVLSSIDSVGSRSITVQADSSAGLESSVLDVVAHISGVEVVAGFGPAHDVENASFPGQRVPMRFAYGGALAVLGASDAAADGAHSYITHAARHRLGLLGVAGGLIRPDSGESFSVAGQIQLPPYMQQYEPLVVAVDPESATTAPLGLMVVVAEAPSDVAAVAEAVQSVLVVEDPSKVRVSTNARVAELRSEIEGRLGTSNRELVLGIYFLTAMLVCAVLSGVVMLRRKDFGRRRALGASQGLIVALVLLQTAWPSLIGVLLGSGGTTLFLVLVSLPTAPPLYTGAVAITSVGIAVTAALLPAWLASRRDPLLELRIP